MFPLSSTFSMCALKNTEKTCLSATWWWQNVASPETGADFLLRRKAEEGRSSQYLGSWGAQLAFGTWESWGAKGSPLSLRTLNASSSHDSLGWQESSIHNLVCAKGRATSPREFPTVRVWVGENQEQGLKFRHGAVSQKMLNIVGSLLYFRMEGEQTVFLLVHSIIAGWCTRPWNSGMPEAWYKPSLNQWQAKGVWINFTHMHFQRHKRRNHAIHMQSSHNQYHLILKCVAIRMSQ